MSESDHTSPKPSERSPPEAKTEGAAKDDVSADSGAGTTDPTVTNNNHEPTREVDDRTDDGGGEEPHTETESVWRQARTNPLAFFTLVLAGATGLVAVSTIALAVVSGFTMWATFGLRDATTNLVTATNRIADYAKEQGKQLESSLKIAQDSVNAAVNLVAATQKVATANEKSAQIAQGQLDVAKELLEIQRVSIPGNYEKDRGRIVVPDVTVRNIVTSSGPADIKPVAGPLEARITIHNEGATRSKDISGWAFAIVVPKGKKGNFAPVTSNKIVFDFGVLESRDEKSGTVQLPLSPADIGKVTGGEEATLFVYGQINYTDVGRIKLFPRKFRFQSEQPAVVGNGTLRLIHANEGNEESE